ncbi:hypothetical protein D9757_010923 [Collybiopsis confluens]|uniref:Uncharacterized protein n=1 Tax=Collybiopsis confluens TaxID=2823264 RepID=A0A8H5GIC2_9AGAR|nr:hypothetical protein D9757_014705 [Collybiopsis confluens]KAF5365548.1 hypothetical protein D9757_010923 [Collybiopsis confluens]
MRVLRYRERGREEIRERSWKSLEAIPTRRRVVEGFMSRHITHRIGYLIVKMGITRSDEADEEEEEYRTILQSWVIICESKYDARRNAFLPIFDILRSCGSRGTTTTSYDGGNKGEENRGREKIGQVDDAGESPQSHRMSLKSDRKFGRAGMENYRRIPLPSSFHHLRKYHATQPTKFTSNVLSASETATHTKSKSPLQLVVYPVSKLTLLDDNNATLSSPRAQPTMVSPCLPPPSTTRWNVFFPRCRYLVQERSEVK